VGAALTVLRDFKPFFKVGQHPEQHQVPVHRIVEDGDHALDLPVAGRCRSGRRPTRKALLCGSEYGRRLRNDFQGNCSKGNPFNNGTLVVRGSLFRTPCSWPIPLYGNHWISYPLLNRIIN
jgi:hypothetical protein